MERLNLLEFLTDIARKHSLSVSDIEFRKDADDYYFIGYLDVKENFVILYTLK